MLQQLLLVTTLSFAVSTMAAAEGLTMNMPEMKRVSETNIVGRQVVRYEHESLPQWGYAKPQHDYFYVLHPKNPPIGKAPLRVILHSAGGGSEAEMHIVLGPHTDDHPCHPGEDSFGLYLDCKENQAVDWFWGLQEIHRNPA